MVVRILAPLFAALLLAVATPVQPAVAQSSVCDDGIDNDVDGDVDWWEDESCAGDPAGPSEGPLVVCNDGLDNDADGVVDLDDPGCRGKRTGTDEADPAPVPSTLTLRTLRPYGCGIETGVRVLPDLAPKRLFPFADVEVQLQGIAGPARGLHKTRRLPLGRDPGYLFKSLRRGRYRVRAQYVGDPFRLASAIATRTIRLSRGRCRVYFAGTDLTRRYRPRLLAIGASQRIDGVVWQRWGRRAARGTASFPANDCNPYCAAGTITRYPVTVRLSRARVCGRYLQFLTLRWTYRGSRPAGAQPTEKVGFDYAC
jgi:hypothetical protein